MTDERTDAPDDGRWSTRTTQSQRNRQWASESGHQAVPLASFHPGLQGRQHSIGPDRRFDPVPAGPDVSTLCRPNGHWRWCSVRGHGQIESTFLHPFAPRALPRLIATMGALTSCRVSRTPDRISLLHASHRRTVRPPNTPRCHCHRFSSHALSVAGSPLLPHEPRPGGCQSVSGLRQYSAGSPQTPGRIGFVILKTGPSPPVAFHPASRRRSFIRLPGMTWYQGTDFHRPDEVRSQAHGARRPRR